VKYLSVCAGIEAASVAWHHMGWEPVAFSEIEKFPSAVLAHHYPNVPNWGDMTKFKEWPDANIDVLVGGTPCQSFSVAGLRKGLDDPRGNLMLTYLAIAQRYRPQWLVWENVPGVLSSEGGRDFAALLRGLAELGYGWAYRVLDAQYFGVAQRRRRVFVVGYLGDWHRAAAVLFERHSLSGHPAPSRQARKGTAGSVAPGVVGSLDTECGGGKLTHQSANNGHLIALQDVRAVEKAQNGKGWNDDGSAYTVDTHATQGVTVAIQGTVIGRSDQDTASLVTGCWWDGEDVAPTLTKQNASGAQRMPDKANFGAVLQPAHTFKVRGGCEGSGADASGAMFTLTKTDVHAVAFGGDIARSLTARHDSSPCADRGMDVVAVNIYGGNKRADRPEGGFYVRTDEDTSKTLDAASGLNPTCSQGGTVVMQTMQVRRLTPMECERLQGFPDGYTNIPWRGKEDSPDGPRYKALGNSMAVPVMRWIGERINEVSKL